MARKQSTDIFDAVEKILPSRWIAEEAERVGCIKRQRKLNLLVFVRCLVLGMGTAGGRSLCALRRLYMKTSGES